MQHEIMSQNTQEQVHPDPSSKQDSTLSVICHLLGLACFVFPLGNIFGPLILWLIKRVDSPYLDAVGKEVINFNISWAIYTILAALSCFLLVGFVVLPIVMIVWLILVIRGALAASDGRWYRYPLTLRFLK